MIAAVVALAASGTLLIIFSAFGGRGKIVPVFRGPDTLSKGDVLFDGLEMNGPESPYNFKAGEIFRNDTFVDAMRRAGFDAAFTEDVSWKMKGVLNSGRCMPGDTFEVKTDKAGKLLRFEYRSSPVEVYVYEQGPDGRFVAYKEEFEEEKKIEWVTGKIDNSLYEAVIAAGEDPGLSMMIANEVFAWDIDFYTEAQKGDTFKIAVEKYVSGDYFIKYGRILAAEYSGNIGTKQAFYWVDPKGKGEYYNGQGIATRRVFLRSPLKYAYVTSSFGMRFHPILQKKRMHTGVDYGAAIGTPVWAIADGVVINSGYRGGLGNAVTIKHRGGYVSTYGHMSKISPKARTGKQVRQSTVIGNVGSTGLSTGPHLHFSLALNGKFINPRKKVAPPVEPIAAQYLASFKEGIKPWIEKLADVKVQEIKIAPAKSNHISQRLGQGG